MTHVNNTDVVNKKCGQLFENYKAFLVSSIFRIKLQNTLDVYQCVYQNLLHLICVQSKVLGPSCWSCVLPLHQHPNVLSTGPHTVFLLLFNYNRAEVKEDCWRKGWKYGAMHNKIYSVCACIIRSVELLLQ